MKVINTKPLANGRRRLTIEVDAGEDLISVHADGNYRLGDPTDIVIYGHDLIGAQRVNWCTVEQQWV